jgi:hypothetical protein
VCGVLGVVGTNLRCGHPDVVLSLMGHATTRNLTRKPVSKVLVKTRTAQTLSAHIQNNSKPP